MSPFYTQKNNRISMDFFTLFLEREHAATLRLRKVAFNPVDADALRLVVTEAWGGGKAHVFSFDAR